MLSRQQVFHGKLLRVVVDTVQGEIGESKTREVVMHPPVVAVLPVLPNNRILLVEQYRHPVGTRLWEVPAGKIDPGESPLQAVRRELKEETGYDARTWHRAASFYSSPGFTDEKITLFIAEDLTQTGQPDRSEISDTAVFAFSRLMSALDSGSLADSKTLIALLWWAHAGPSTSHSTKGKERHVDP